MRKLFLLPVLIILASCCNDDLNSDFVVCDVDAVLTTRLFTKVRQTFPEGRDLSGQMDQYIPVKFAAYFVADENLGQYEKGSLVREIEVREGRNEITIPEMRLKVVVTNYHKEGDWYLDPDAFSQLPTCGDTLYMIGSSIIDYRKKHRGIVLVVNPMIDIKPVDRDFDRVTNY